MPFDLGAGSDGLACGETLSELVSLAVAIRSASAETNKKE